MLGRLAYRLVSALPPSWLRRIGAWQWAGALQRRLVRIGSTWLRQRDVTIRHGAAAGLRFNPGGANPGYALGTTEPVLQEALAERLRPGDVVYDIGANVGFFTVLAARLVGPTGRVVAFEPLPANLAALRHNIALNHFDNVTVIDAAVAAAAGTAGLVLGGEPTWARLATRTGEPAGTAAGQGAADAARPAAITVRLVSVDELLANGTLPPPTLVKIDVEGAELEVVGGMTATLRAHGPILLCEMHGKNREFAALMHELEYLARPLEGREPVESARWDVHVVAIPAPGHESTR
ncbi:MAG TPA: FkbM family methyltransferase [Gemmatimonadales bacterium]|nr:FkbM family methyltransferase [Gemmatimonadales bacterium]